MSEIVNYAVGIVYFVMLPKILNKIINIFSKKGVGKYIDNLFRKYLPKFAFEKYKYLLIHFQVSSLSDATENAMHIDYNPNTESDLAELCDKYGTDKGELSPDLNPYPWNSHNYSDFYELIFSPRRHTVESLLECGIGTNDIDFTHSMGEKGNPGASLRVWRDYFPNGKIVGVDIDENVMFTEDRIDTYCVDQTSKKSIEKFLDNIDNNFDIIIDDGLHEYHANVSFFENTIDHLNEDGVYIIEDVSHDNLNKYRSYFIDNLNEYHVKFVDLENTYRPNRVGDRLIMITHK